MDTDDSEVAFYAKNAASIEDYRRLTLRGEDNTIQRGEVKTTHDGGKSQVQKVDAGKKRETADKEKSGSWTCDKCTKRNFQYISKDNTVERTNWFHCRAPKNPSTSRPVKDSKPGTVGMVVRDPQVEELTKQVALLSKKQDDDQSLKDEIAQLKRQLAVKESADTNLGTVGIEGHRMTGNDFMLSALDDNADQKPRIPKSQWNESEGEVIDYPKRADKDSETVLKGMDGVDNCSETISIHILHHRVDLCMRYRYNSRIFIQLCLDRSGTEAHSSRQKRYRDSLEPRALGIREICS
jgi:hypothetical protein